MSRYGKSKRRAEPIRVCRYCLQEIEYSMGKQSKHIVYVNEHDDNESRCAWCKESGNGTLFVLHNQRA